MPISSGGASATTLPRDRTRVLSRREPSTYALTKRMATTDRPSLWADAPSGQCERAAVVPSSVCVARDSARADPRLPLALSTTYRRCPSAPRGIDSARGTRPWPNHRRKGLMALNATRGCPLGHVELLDHAFQEV